MKIFELLENRDLKSEPDPRISAVPLELNPYIQKYADLFINDGIGVFRGIREKV